VSADGSVVEITSLAAPVGDRERDELAGVLSDCVAGGASINFMAPFSRGEARAFFDKVAGGVASGDLVLLVARLGGRVVGTVQLGLDTPPNQPHRADIKKMLGASFCARPWRWCGIDGGRRRRSAAPRALAPGARHRARRKRASALCSCGMATEQHGAGLRTVSGWPALRHRDHVEAAEVNLPYFTPLVRDERPRKTADAARYSLCAIHAFISSIV
jgi:hypothetical protein